MDAGFGYRMCGCRFSLQYLDAGCAVHAQPLYVRIDDIVYACHNIMVKLNCVLLY